MPVPKSKQGKPLGGIGAERQSRRKHSLILDDRLLSKQYITSRVDSKVDDTAFSASWSNDTSTAPSKAALHAKFNALSVTTSSWTQETDLSTSKTKTYDSGFVGIGSAVDYDNDITEMLTVGGNIKGTGNVLLKSDSAVLKFGADLDTTLTHTDGTGLTLNSTNKLCFNDASQFIHGSSNAVLSLGATDEIDLTATDIDINGNTDVSGTLAVGSNITVGGTATITGNTTIAGNLTVTGTATAIETTNISTKDNLIILNSEEDGAGVTAGEAGIEIERGSATNVAIKWNEGTDAWQLTNDGTTYTNISTSSSDHSAVTIDNQGLGLLSLSSQAITVNDVMLKKNGAGTLDVTGSNEKLVVTGNGGDSGSTALQITGGTSASSNAAVSITGHLEATTKSFNIPHPLLEHKRLVYGSLEGPEHGMYARGSFDVLDERRKVAIDLPMYWSKMVHPDYTVNLTTYGNYNVWIAERDENGFWVETNSEEEEWSFDWNVIGGRKDAKLVVEPDA